ncbi:MAG: FAD binding domain-containing protein [Candidatus Tritonobacter lacicola]|nr:FAD binding domain-containing protein [Candidatus Tritonobacter lacicola]
MKLPNIKKVSYPESTAEAVAILSDEKRNAVPLSGGVSFIFASTAGVEELVCLNRLPLRYIKKKNGGLLVGATTLVSELVEAGAVGSYADGILREAARRVGSTLNRNLITVGGSLVQPFIWSDLPAVALAMGAKIRIQGKKSRTIDAEKFYARPPRQLLKGGDLVTEVLFPAPPPGSRAAYRKFALTENDFAILKVAILLSRRKRLCREITVAVGGATVLPQRTPMAEAALRGKQASQVLVNEASELAAEEIKVSRDMRCSNDYKRELCRVMVRAILEEILLDQKVAEWKLF